jgi:hypothetical protein
MQKAHTGGYSKVLKKQKPPTVLAARLCACLPKGLMTEWGLNKTVVYFNGLSS